MGLIQFEQFEDGVDATANLFNEQIAKIYNEFDGNIESENLKNGAVTSAKIATGAVTSDKISTSKYTDDNGWLVQDFGTFKMYSRKATVTNITLAEGERNGVATVVAPIGKSRDNLIFLTSWHGGYGGHAITGTEDSGDNSIGIILAHNWPSALTFNGSINVLAIEAV